MRWQHKNNSSLTRLQMASKPKAFWIFPDSHLLESKTRGRAARGVPLFSLSLLERATSAASPQPGAAQAPSFSLRGTRVPSTWGTQWVQTCAGHCWASVPPCSPGEAGGLRLSAVPGGPQRGRGACERPPPGCGAGASSCPSVGTTLLNLVGRHDRWESWR